MQGGARIEGVPELQKKLTPKMAAKPARDFLSRWAISTQSDARAFSPVDRGNLRANIDYEIEEGPEFPEFAVVGTNVTYAPPMEFGTGLLFDPGESEDAQGGGSAHYPPVGPIEAWAVRVGFPKGSGANIARAIGRRGGLEPRKFLTRAAMESESRIPKYAQQMADEIERNASR